MLLLISECKSTPANRTLVYVMVSQSFL